MSRRTRHSVVAMPMALPSKKVCFYVGEQLVWAVTMDVDGEDIYGPKALDACEVYGLIRNVAAKLTRIVDQAKPVEKPQESTTAPQ